MQLLVSCGTPGRFSTAAALFVRVFFCSAVCCPRHFSTIGIFVCVFCCCAVHWPGFSQISSSINSIVFVCVFFLLRGPLARLLPILFSTRLLPNQSSVNFVVFVCVLFCCAVHWPGFSQIIPQSISSSPPAPLLAARSGVLPQPSCVFFSQPNRQCGLLARPSHQSASSFCFILLR